MAPPAAKLSAARAVGSPCDTMSGGPRRTEGEECRRRRLGRARPVVRDPRHAAHLRRVGPRRCRRHQRCGRTVVGAACASFPRLLCARRRPRAAQPAHRRPPPARISPEDFGGMSTRWRQRWGAPGGTWGVDADGGVEQTSYNTVMTSTTTAPTIASTSGTRPRFRLTRQSLVAFVAGLAVAGTLAVGINAATGDDATPAPASPYISLHPSDHCTVIQQPC